MSSAWLFGLETSAANKTGMCMHPFSGDTVITAAALTCMFDFARSWHVPEKCSSAEHADVLDTLEAVRVHSSEASGPSCRLHAPEMPGGRAWISAGGHLTLGTVDLELKLRTTRQGDNLPVRCTTDINTFNCAFGCT